MHVHVRNWSQEREQIKLTWRKVGVQKETTRLHFGSHLSMAELPLVQVLQQQLAHVTSEREDLHGGAIASSES